jgi:hypothetical protein
VKSGKKGRKAGGEDLEGTIGERDLSATEELPCE